ncbi:hypothetical protein E5288_WYG003015 [Bos mutus]|uniref:Uncharacterized protein n=1 Tax=Bos mutus TaxID=72004 RepID=A0A6B0R9D5_9CETA|nr:hypothetical protein [Bos mutus]
MPSPPEKPDLSLNSNRVREGHGPPFQTLWTYYCSGAGEKRGGEQEAGTTLLNAVLLNKLLSAEVGKRDLISIDSGIGVLPRQGNVHTGTAFPSFVCLVSTVALGISRPFYLDQHQNAAAAPVIIVIKPEQIPCEKQPLIEQCLTLHFEHE